MFLSSQFGFRSVNACIGAPFHPPGVAEMALHTTAHSEGQPPVDTNSTVGPGVRQGTNSTDLAKGWCAVAVPPHCCAFS